jgi:hypothetical protein
MTRCCNEEQGVVIMHKLSRTSTASCMSYTSVRGTMLIAHGVDFCSAMVDNLASFLLVGHNSLFADMSETDPLRAVVAHGSAGLCPLVSHKGTTWRINVR